MSRPTLYENMKLTTISVSADDLKRAKEAGVNVSEVCRNALSSILVSDTLSKYERKHHIRSKFKHVPPYKMRKMRMCILEYGDSVIDRWILILAKYGCSVTKEEIIEVIK